MKHYKESYIYKILNIISEFLLAFVAYLLSTLIRLHISASLLKHYEIGKLFLYLPFGILLSSIWILINIILGDYKTVHYRNITYELKRIVIIALFTVISGSATIFWFMNSDISRSLLIIYFFVIVILISIKRILVHRLSNFIISRNDRYNVLIIGSDDMAIRYAKELILGKEERYQFVGYLGREELDLTNYCGSILELSNVLKNKEVNQVVISENCIDKGELDKIVDICLSYNVEIQLIPTFSEYINDGYSIVKTRVGTKLVKLNKRKTTNILGVNIAVTNIDEIIESVSKNLNEWKGQYICVSNVHTTVMAYENEDYCKIQNEAILALPDGGPLSSYSRLGGEKKAERVTGPDFMQAILHKSAENGWSHFFYGSSEETLTKLNEVIKEKYPGVKIAGMISPPYRELTEDEDKEYIKQINDSKPDFVWVGLGAPKQEIWMNKHKELVNGLMVGVGAAFDYESGNIKRAPKWMQRCSLEWLYRLIQDPKRLIKRYVVTNLKYIWLTRY